MFQARQDWFYGQRTDASGRLPPRAIENARAQDSALQSAGLLGTAPQGQVSANAVVASSWSQVGPAPISDPAGFVDHTNNSGRAVALALVNATTWYVGTAEGGVWRTTDAGSSWTPLTDQQPSLAVSSIAVDPANASAIWVGTGEADCTYDSYYGAGVLRSTDGGATWTQSGNVLFGSSAVAHIAIDPTSSPSARRLYAAVSRCVSGRYAGGAFGAGLARSLDGGATWSFLTTDPNLVSQGVRDVRVTATGTLYVAVDLTSTAAGIYRSTDGGASFTKLTNGLPTSNVGRIGLALASSNANVLYAAIENKSNFQLFGVYRSVDAGDSWTKTSFVDTSLCNPSPCDQWYFDNVVTIDPTNVNTIYVGGVDVFKSADGGTTWTNLTHVYSIAASGAHPDQHDIVVLPSAPSTVVVANDGGVFKSGDGGLTWQHANGTAPSALATVQGIRGAAHPTDANTFYMGTQDNGELKFTGLPTWNVVIGGDAGYTEVDYATPSTVYEEYIYLQIRRSDASGAVGSWAPKTTGFGPERTASTTAFYAPFVMDPTTPTTLYAGTNRVYKTTNRGDLWTPLSATALTQTYLTAIGVSASASNIIYAGSSTGAIWVTTNGGASWTGPLANTAGLPAGTVANTGRYLTDLAVDPTNANVAYATYSGFNAYATASGPIPGHVFRTTNGGATWTSVSAALPDIPANAVILDRTNPSIVYVATDIGVYRSADGGATWSPMNAGLPKVGVWHLVLNRAGDTMFAVTHGRSVYRATITNAVATTVTVSPASALVPLGGAQQFSASVKDASGNELTGQTLTWSVAPTTLGSISASGLFTAAAAQGSGTVTASVGAVSGSAALTVTNAVPLYLPNVTKTLGGPAGWTTPIAIQNTGAAPTTVSVTLYKFADGALVATKQSPSVQPGQSWIFDPLSYPDLPGDTQFSVVAQPVAGSIAAVVLEGSGASWMAYSGTATGAATVYLPNITRNLGGPAGWNTPFIVQNLGSSAVTCSVLFYNFSDGALALRIDNVTLQPGRAQPFLPQAIAGLPDDRQYAVVVQGPSGSQLYAVVNEHQGAQAMSYEGLLAGAQTVYLPNIVKYLGGTEHWSTPFIVQNLGSTTTSFALLFYSFSTGALVQRVDGLSLAPGRSYADDVRFAPAGLPAGQYSVVVQGAAGAQLGAVVNQHEFTAGMAMSYQGISGGSTAAFLPYLQKTNGGALWTSPIIAQNLGATPSDVTITLYDTAGTVRLQKVYPSVAPGAAAVLDPRDVPALPSGVYSAIVQAASAVAATVNHSGEIAGDYAMSYTSTRGTVGSSGP